MTPERLQELIDRFPAQRIAVLGDFFLDKYLETDPALAEPSLETGKQAHQVVAVRRSPGAAGTVVSNLAALKAGALHAIGAIGDDGEGYDLRQALGRLGCTTDFLLRFDSLMTPTYLKPRDVTRPGLEGEHERYDTKNRRPTPPEVVRRVIESVDAILPEVDALVIQDQVVEDDFGIVTAAVRDALAERAGRFPRTIFLADSRTHVRQFRNVMIKPNQFEATGRGNPLPGDQVDLAELRNAIPHLRSTIGAPVFVTCGSQGMLISDPEPTHVPGVHVDGPIDPTGAGDSAMAGIVLALAAGATFADAALVGNLVASITIQHLSTTGTATPEQVLQRLVARHG